MRSRTYRAKASCKKVGKRRGGARGQQGKTELNYVPPRTSLEHDADIKSTLVGATNTSNSTNVNKSTTTKSSSSQTDEKIEIAVTAPLARNSAVATTTNVATPTTTTTSTRAAATASTTANATRQQRQTERSQKFALAQRIVKLCSKLDRLEFHNLGGHCVPSNFSWPCVPTTAQQAVARNSGTSTQPRGHTRYFAATGGGNDQKRMGGFNISSALQSVPASTTILQHQQSQLGGHGGLGNTHVPSVAGRRAVNEADVQQNAAGNLPPAGHRNTDSQPLPVRAARRFMHNPYPTSNASITVTNQQAVASCSSQRQPQTASSNIPSLEDGIALGRRPQHHRDERGSGRSRADHHRVGNAHQDNTQGAASRFKLDSGSSRSGDDTSGTATSTSATARAAHRVDHTTAGPVDASRTTTAGPHGAQFQARGSGPSYEMRGRKPSGRVKDSAAGKAQVAGMATRNNDQVLNRSGSYGASAPDSRTDVAHSVSNSAGASSTTSAAATTTKSTADAAAANSSASATETATDTKATSKTTATTRRGESVRAPKVHTGKLNSNQRRDAKRMCTYREENSLLREYDLAASRMESVLGSANRASIVTRRHVSKRPMTQEERELPVHSVPVKQMDVDTAISMMLPKVRDRFQQVYDLLEQPEIVTINFFNRKMSDRETKHSTSLASFIQQNADHQPSKFLTTDDADKMVADGIVKPISAELEKSSPTLGTMKAFTVVEMEKKRRRVIHWPEAHNTFLNEAYQPELSLDHISKYLKIAHANSGAVLDLRCGFWQVPISEKARPYYRFRDASGRLFEMTRLMMGHRASVELMQILTSVVAGDPNFVSRKYAAPENVGISVWVDGICFFGEEKDVHTAIEAAQRRAKKLRMTFKEPAQQPQSEFEYIGVQWNLKNHTVTLAEKTRKRLPKQLPSQGEYFMTAQEVEQLAGRLIHAAGVTQTPLVNYYYAMKFARRICNTLNNGAHPNHEVRIRGVALAQLHDWINEALATHKPRLIDQGAIAPVLFVDATLEDYGAVLVLPTSQVLTSGGKFTDGESKHIAIREAEAVLFGLQDFERHLNNDAVRVIEIRSDNTTAENLIRRGTSKTEELARVIKKIMRASLKWNAAIDIRRIESKANPADELSRNVELDMAKLQRALANRDPAYTRSGAGRIFV